MMAAHNSKVANVFHIVFARILWAAACAAIFSACIQGLWPKFNTVLCWRGFTPLARLTYGAFLWHPVVIKTAGALAQEYYHFSAYLIVSRWILNTMLSFALSGVTFLILERPVLILTKEFCSAQQQRDHPQIRESVQLSQFNVPNGLNGLNGPNGFHVSETYTSPRLTPNFR
jgi:peptidoglycan/LPS O-acetylase OafA/YrhL